MKLLNVAIITFHICLLLLTARQTTAEECPNQNGLCTKPAIEEIPPPTPTIELEEDYEIEESASKPPSSFILKKISPLEYSDFLGAWVASYFDKDLNAHVKITFVIKSGQTCSYQASAVEVKNKKEISNDKIDAICEYSNGNLIFRGKDALGKSRSSSFKILNRDMHGFKAIDSVNRIYKFTHQ